MIYKTQPNRDLAIYFETNPSFAGSYAASTGAAAIYHATDTECHLAGSFSDAYDWSVCEWNRDNVFEHLALRPLPDGDFTGVTVSYRHSQDDCVVPFDSFLFDWQDWSSLRIFTDQNAEPYLVPLKNYATAHSGQASAAVTLTLSGTRTPSDAFGITSMGENYWSPVYPYSRTFSYFATSYGTLYGLIINGVNYLYTAVNPDTSTDVAIQVAALINADTNCPVTAVQTTNSVGLTGKGISGTLPATFNVTNENNSVTDGPYGMGNATSATDFQDIAASIATATSIWYTFVASGNSVTLTSIYPGTSGNRLAVTTLQSSSTANWSTVGAVPLTGGANPDYWTITLPFSSLMGLFGGVSVSVPVTNIRAMRWTFAPEPVTSAPWTKQDYKVHMTNWTVSGGTPTLSYCGPLTVRIDDQEATFAGTWVRDFGNYLGGSEHYGDTSACTATVDYSHPATHDLWLGSRTLNFAGIISVTVDGGTPVLFDLYIPTGSINDDRMVRLKVGSVAAGAHTVVVANTGTKNTASGGWRVYFDFLEATVGSSDPPTFSADPSITLATDWDTLATQPHSPERVLWDVTSLGFTGPTNHYIGALQWYNLEPAGGTMAGATVTFAGTVVTGDTLSVIVDGFSFLRVFLPGDTLDTIASSIAQEMSCGSTSIWGSSSGSTLTINARRRSGGVDDPNSITLTVTNTGGVTPTASGSTLSGGVAYTWVTDKTSIPRLNNATYNWIANYCIVLQALGMTGVLAFSQELGQEPLASTLAQRYSDGTASWLNTPSLMCNFGPNSLAYLQQAYLDVAQLMNTAGLQAYLQFGEVFWWYFPTRYDTTNTLVVPPSLALYDSYTTGLFTTTYGGSMHVFPDEWDGNHANTVASITAAYPHECALLPKILGEYLAAIQTFVKATVSSCKFQVLYPLDVNDGPVTQIINSPDNSYSGYPAMDSWKTEGFGYYFAFNLDLVKTLINHGFTVRNFPRTVCHVNHGANTPLGPYARGLMYAKEQGIGPSTLWAKDQVELTSPSLPLYSGSAKWAQQ